MTDKKPKPLTILEDLEDRFTAFDEGWVSLTREQWKELKQELIAQGKLAVLEFTEKDYKRIQKQTNPILPYDYVQGWKGCIARLKSQLSRGEQGDAVKGEASAQIQDAKPRIPEVSPRNPESFPISDWKGRKATVSWEKKKVR